MEKFCKQEASEICNMHYAAQVTEKCSIGDLKKLSLRIVLESRVKEANEICNMHYAAQVTEKCSIGDLKKLSLRIVLESRVKGHEQIEENDVHEALIDFHPSCSQIGNPINLVKSDLKWEDVGGLDDVKQILTEVFIWPTKYPTLFRNSSIRHGRGVLLHGPSGCGKTLISKVLAAQCNFNVIFVKVTYHCF
ncbi:unnamed protein product [Gongylonema pulchrum]|uniref:ATPase AAA-type core domain-containing protein n=1 Tax=Gongylonema pulchrum TaxID=637853 RepID=A0A3P7PE60_9BILA|nr:unnamed protein product [Gongylonema pulchrum]